MLQIVASAYLNGWQGRNTALPSSATRMRLRPGWNMSTLMSLYTVASSPFPNAAGLTGWRCCHDLKRFDTDTIEIRQVSSSASYCRCDQISDVLCLYRRRLLLLLPNPFPFEPDTLPHTLWAVVHPAPLGCFELLTTVLAHKLYLVWLVSHSSHSFG